MAGFRSPPSLEGGPTRVSFARARIGPPPPLGDRRLELIPTAEQGLPEHLAGAIDAHLATFAQHVREGLLAASPAVGLEVMAEIMQAEVTALAGVKAATMPIGPSPITAPSEAQSPWADAEC